MPEPRYAPVSVRGSVWGLLTAYWFAPAAALVVALIGFRSQPTLVTWFVLIVVAAGLIGAFIAAGAAIDATDTEVVVRRRWRGVWRIPAGDLRVVEEHIPLRPRSHALAGWVFRGQGEDRVTIEISQFSPLDRRKLRKAFADILVSPDATKPPGLR